MNFLQPLIFLGFFCAVTVRADTVITTDTFKTGGSGRDVGASLNSTKPEQGDGPWVTTEHFKFAGDNQNGSISSIDHQGGSGRVAIPDNATSVKIELDFQFADTTDSPWVGIGLGDADANHTFYCEPTGMLLCLNQAGSALLCTGSTPVKLGTKPAVKSNDLNHLTLLYNYTTKTVSAWVNNVAICDENTPCPVSITAHFGGFSCFGTKPETKMENFKMTVQTADASVAKP